MKKPNVAPKKNTSKFPKSDLSDKDIAVADGDVPPPKKEGGPVPTPDYTLEQLLANIPEPDPKMSKSNSSEEVDTGKPVGKEVW
jgi:hypothetical protein